MIILWVETIHFREIRLNTYCFFVLQFYLKVNADYIICHVELKKISILYIKTTKILFYEKITVINRIVKKPQFFQSSSSKDGTRLYSWRWYNPLSAECPSRVALRVLPAVPKGKYIPPIRRRAGPRHRVSNDATTASATTPRSKRLKRHVKIVV